MRVWGVLWTGHDGEKGPKDVGSGCEDGRREGRAGGRVDMEAGLVGSAEGDSGGGCDAAGFPPRAAHSSGVGG